MDENIGRLIDSIDSKVKEGYNFIYTSERGRFTGEFGWFGSEWMYEPSARIPMVFANFKGLSAPVFKTEEIFRDFDLYSLIKNLVQPMTSGPTQIMPQPSSTRIGNNQLYFSHLDHPGESGVSPHHGLRKGKYKIVHYYPFDEWEFFDLENDPKELQNLYNHVTHSTVVSEYKEYLDNAGEFRKNKRENQLFSETWKRKQRSPENKKR